MIWDEFLRIQHLKIDQECTLLLNNLLGITLFIYIYVSIFD